MEKQPIRMPRDSRPMLSVVIHTEEEFDWARGFDRGATGVSHMRYIGRVQDLCDAAGIIPTYVVDYPIADQDDGCHLLEQYAASGQALIGTHLHPWVSPPHSEELCARNSYPGNLPRGLEREKLRQLTGRITARFGMRPLVYLAGRYGLGPNTAAILEELGYEVDLSPCVPMDFTSDGGPDYSGVASVPYWFGEGRRLLGLPCSGGFVGWLPGDRRAAYRLATHHRLAWTRLPGILARLGALERISLSPEGFTHAEHRRLTRAMLDRGYRCFVFSFHSPSVQPGLTPYVRDGRDLKVFLARCRDYFAFFLGELGGEAMTPLAIKNLLHQVAGEATPAAECTERRTN
jgi:hypothetical protein